MTRMITLAHLSAIDLAPPALIRTAAEAGFDGVGLRLLRVTPDSPGYPLMDDPVMMRDTKAAVQDSGAIVHDIEFVKITPETEVEALLPFLDAGAELSAREVITAPYDPDLNRLADRLAALSEAAKARGLGVVLEFFPWTVVPSLEAALPVVDQAGSDVGILVDSLHFDRSTSQLETLAQIPSNRLRFAHLCDAMVQDSYTESELLFTARAERLPPGHGQIDLSALLRALPENLPLGIELPQTARSQTASALELLTEAYEATVAVVKRMEQAA
jgi:sugar phosphate isomerase/epimerase